MQKVFRKIKEELKMKARAESDKCAEWVKIKDADRVAKYNHGEYCYLDSIHTVERFVKKYGIDWIPCDERYPDTDDYILLSFENFSIPIIGRYKEDAEGGAFYAGNEDETLVSHGLIVNAWRRLPEPYTGRDNGFPFNSETGSPAAEGCAGFESEEPKISNGDKIRRMSDEELADAMLEIEDIEAYAPFCGSLTKCDEIMDKGELIPEEMCKQCLLKWLKMEAK